MEYIIFTKKPNLYNLYLEPIDCAAVDQRGKLSQSIAERVADRTHRQNDMQLIAAPLYEQVEQRDWRAVGLLRFVPLPVQHAHFIAYLLLLVEWKQIRHLACIQQIIYIF